MPVSSEFARFVAIFRPLPFVAAVALALHWVRLPGDVGASFGRAEAAQARLGDEYEVCAILAKKLGLSCSPSDVFFVDGPRGLWEVWFQAQAFVLGTVDGAQDDVFLVRLRRSPEGRVLSVENAFNLSQTSAVSEEQLASSDGLAAWLVGNEQRAFHLKLRDAKRKPQLDHRATSGLKRFQQALTFLQQTGKMEGLAERNFKFDPPVKWARIKVSVEGLHLFTDTSVATRGGLNKGSAIVVPRGAAVKAGAHLLVEQPVIPGAPGNLVTWAVDRVRGMSWFGDDNMQLLKALAYKVLDFKDRTLGGGDHEGPQTPPSFGAAVERKAHGDTESTFPPPALTPQLDPPLDGEGVWVSLEKDPFVRKLPSGASPFVTTFIRTDHERKFSQIMITAWDPSLVELHMMSGTEEPKSATGETGTGLIPRDPDTLTRLVAAFNGGFQGTHGEFGMQVDGVLYVPPKPYAATVARLTDGTVAFGTWPELAGTAAPIPENMRSFRQNLTPLIQAGQVNPYGRSWWGGVPQEWEDNTRTVRSGLCLTRHGLLAYFYGSKVDHLQLARAMQLTECDYALHLDMNQGHTGLEFYQAGPTETLPPLGLPLSPMWQAEGPIDGAPGFNFRGRRLFRSMQLMNFPRYIQREARDFFYLTLRRRLPGPDLGLPDAATDEGRWSTERFGKVANAPPLAGAWVRPDPSRDGTKVRLVAIDPSLLAPADGGAAPAHALLTIDHNEGPESETSAWWSDGRIIVAPTGPSGARRLLGGSDRAGSETRAAFGLGADGGVLYYAEVATAPEPSRDAELLSKALHAAGAKSVVYMRERPVLSSGGLELSGHPYPPSPQAVSLIAHVSPGFRHIFKNTPIREQSHWQPLQNEQH